MSIHSRPTPLPPPVRRRPRPPSPPLGLILLLVTPSPVGALLSGLPTPPARRWCGRSRGGRPSQRSSGSGATGDARRGGAACSPCAGRASCSCSVALGECKRQEPPLSVPLTGSRSLSPQPPARRCGVSVGTLEHCLAANAANPGICRSLETQASALVCGTGQQRTTRSGPAARAEPSACTAQRALVCWSFYQQKIASSLPTADAAAVGGALPCRGGLPRASGSAPEMLPVSGPALPMCRACVAPCARLRPSRPRWLTLRLSTGCALVRPLGRRRVVNSKGREPFRCRACGCWRRRPAVPALRRCSLRRCGHVNASSRASLTKRPRPLPLPAARVTST